MMLRREIKLYRESIRKEGKSHQNIIPNSGVSSEPIARFLKSYAVFIDDHTSKEDKFFDLVDSSNSISTVEDKMLLEHYEACKKEVGGDGRIQEMIRLIDYIEDQAWMKLK